MSLIETHRFSKHFFLKSIYKKVLIPENPLQTWEYGVMRSGYSVI